MENLRLNEDERELISLAEQLKGMQASYAFRKLREIMRMYEEEALKDMAENLSSDVTLRSNLQIRWQERKSMNAMVDNYLADIESTRKQLLRDIAQSAGATPIQAYEFGENNA